MERAPLLARILSLIFPPYCLHCHEENIPLRRPLCNACISHLEIAPQTGSILVTFERFSPAASLVRELKARGDRYLAGILAAYMTVQYAQSSHPLPDLITSVPVSWWRSMHIGSEAGMLLARHVAALMQVPYLALLKRPRQMFRQELLSPEERRQLSSDEFVVLPRFVRGKTILLIDDIVGTGATLHCCMEKLWELHPRRIIPMASVYEGGHS